MSNRIKLKSSKRSISSTTDKATGKTDSESKFDKAKDNKGKVTKTSSANKTQKAFSTKKKLSK